MTHHDRAELTARRLSLRLDELSRALTSSGVATEATAKLLESAAVATMHAVALELLTEDRARTIWSDSGVEQPAPLRRAA